jgi:hypothetical protein
MMLVAGCQQASTPDFSADRFAAHVRALSDDAMAGRRPGTPGYDRAGAWVAGEFERLGLVAVPGLDSFYQPVPMIETTPQRASLTIEGAVALTMDAADQVLALPDHQPQSATVTARAVFAGHGVVAAEFGVDDYAGLDVGGTIVVVRDGAPASLGRDERSYFGMLRTKAREAAAHGAVGLVVLSDKEGEDFRREAAHQVRPWFSWRRRAGEAPAPESALRVTLLLSAEAGAALLEGEGGDAGGTRGFEFRRQLTLAQDNLNRPVESANVIGMLPGSDPEFAHEYVLVMAHLDHLGTDPARAGDRIFNGAMDNATGIATMLEVARAIAGANRGPRRSILFLADTGDETGYAGVDYLAQHLPVPARSVVAALNIDMPYLLFPLRGEGGGIFLYGDKHSTLGARAVDAAARLGIATLPVPDVESTRFPLSDHIPLTERGIPALRIKPGYRMEDPLHRRQRVLAFKERHYHQVSDNIGQPINYQAGADYAAIHYALARDLADSGDRPRWNAASFLARRFARGGGR